MADFGAEALGHSQALLLRVRRTDPAALSSLAPEIENALLGRQAGSSDAERVSPKVRARLIAYCEVVEFDRSGATEGLATSVAEATHELNEVLNFSCRFDVAGALVRIYTARWPSARPVSTLRPFLRDLAAPRDEFRDNPAEDVQIVAKPGASATFVVFCGIRHAFGVQLNLLHHACLASLGVNVVYLRDFSLCHYLAGIRSLGSVEETCRCLQQIFARLNTRKLVLLGNSGGVFGALYYAALLGADQALLFSGPTSLEIGIENSERQVYARLTELRRQGLIEWPDIRALHAEQSIPVSIFFGERNRFDREQAENLRGLPTVRLFPVPTQHHFMVDDLVETGVFQAVMTEVASGAQ